MERELDEVIESQEKMLKRKGMDEDELSKAELKQILKDYKRILKDNIKSHPDMDVIYLSYNDIMSYPEPVLESVSAFLDGAVNVKDMLAVVDDELYRNRVD